MTSPSTAMSITARVTSSTVGSPAVTVTVAVSVTWPAASAVTSESPSCRPSTRYVPSSTVVIEKSTGPGAGESGTRYRRTTRCGHRTGESGGRQGGEVEVGGHRGGVDDLHLLLGRLVPEGLDPDGVGAVRQTERVRAVGRRHRALVELNRGDRGALDRLATTRDGGGDRALLGRRGPGDRVQVDLDRVVRPVTGRVLRLVRGAVRAGAQAGEQDLDARVRREAVAHAVADDRPPWAVRPWTAEPLRQPSHAPYARSGPDVKGQK